MFLMALLFVASCKTKGPGPGPGPGPDPDPKQSEIPAELRQDGMISPSVYQVFITVIGTDREEALQNGQTKAARKVLNLIRKTAQDSGRPISEKSLQELRNMIRENGRIFKMVQEPNGAWSVVYRVEKEGLRGFIRRLE